MTRTEDLKRKLSDAAERFDDLSILVEAMRSSSDDVSTMLLARLRLGASVKVRTQSTRTDHEYAN